MSGPTEAGGAATPDGDGTRRVFRLPGLAWAVVVFLLVGSLPLAFTSNAGEGAPAGIGPRTAVLVLPLLAALFVIRSATIVDGTAITVRAIFGRRRLMWSQVRGLSVSDRSVYAVLVDGSVRLPFVRVANLADVARASGGRLPKIADPTPRYAPSRRRR